MPINAGAGNLEGNAPNKMVIPTFDGLDVLPPVFHIADLTIRFGWKPRECLQQLFRWKSHGKVKEMAGLCGIYANIATHQYPNWELGFRMVAPMALVIGIEILRRAGWTTQIPYVPTVAVSETQRIKLAEHFEILVQPQEWYSEIVDGVQSGEGIALPHLAPAWALADLIKREGWCDCGLGPDDIYWGMVTEKDQIDWANACTALGLGALPMNPDSNRTDYGARPPNFASF